MTVGLAFALGALFFVAIVPLDPYDTGLLTPLRPHGAFAKGPRLANASRIRDESFDAAIFGNSHIMTLSPERLSQATGLRFVMLAIPGTGVPEQMQVMDAYLERHSTPRAVVIAVDPLYCLDDPRESGHHPFPDWLYASSRLSYLIGLARLRTLEAAGQRIEMLLGRKKAQPRDGAMDIFDGHGPDPEADAARVATAPREDLSNPPQSHRPGLDALRIRLGRLRPETRAILVLPPVAPSILPRSGTPAEAALLACKTAVSSLREAHQGTVIVDWHRLTPALEQADLFFDATHYYDPIARLMEADIASALREH